MQDHVHSGGLRTSLLGKTYESWFGLWLKTYFRVISGDNCLGALLSSTDCEGTRWETRCSAVSLKLSGEDFTALSLVLAWDSLLADS